MGQHKLSRGCGPMAFSGVIALHLAFSACLFPDNPSYSLDPMKLKLCKFEDYDVE